MKSYKKYLLNPFTQNVKKGQTYFKVYVWPFYNIMHERVKVTFFYKSISGNNFSRKLTCFRGLLLQKVAG